MEGGDVGNGIAGCPGPKYHGKYVPLLIGGAREEVTSSASQIEHEWTDGTACE